jgi:hypothetical protein
LRGAGGSASASAVARHLAEDSLGQQAKGTKFAVAPAE